MSESTQIMVQMPAALQLPQMADMWEAMHAELGHTVTDEEKAEYERDLRERYRDRTVFMLVGMRPMGDERAGELVAYMVSRLQEGEPRHGIIEDLYVQPSFRGNNLARHMVEAASGWLRAQGCKFLEAGTLTSNRRGMAFLASMQFQLHSSVLRRPL